MVEISIENPKKMASSTTSTARKNPLTSPHPVRNPPVNARKEIVKHSQKVSKTKNTTKQLPLRKPEFSSPKRTDPILEAVKELTLNPGLGSPSVSHCYENALSISVSQYSEPGRDSFVTARVSQATTGACSVKNVGDDPNRRSDTSDESNGGGANVNKPHKANDSRWEAIQAVRAQKGENTGLSNFRLLKRLGCGDIGSVHLVELSGTGCYFAMKIMDKDALEAKKKLPRAQTEKEILQCLDHPFLPTLYTHFETQRFSCLVMEFCPGGDLHTLRQRQLGRYFSEKAARFYAAEVLLALEYLHMLGIIYRDLKPENVLVREDGHIMLSDFDLSLRCSVSPTLIRSSRHVTIDMPSKSSSSSSSSSSSGHCIQPPSCMQPTCFAPPWFLMNNRYKGGSLKSNPRNSGELSPELLAEPTGARSMSFVGTHEYLAPEIIKGEGHGSAVDWWTFGIFLYELMFGKTPFKGSGNRATLFNVVGEPLKFPEAPPVSFAARDLIRGLLVKEPQQRLACRRGATELKQHPFFESVNWALVRCACPPEIPRLSKQSNDGLPAFACGENGEGSVDVKPSDRFLDIDFF